MHYVTLTVATIRQHILLHIILFGNLIAKHGFDVNAYIYEMTLWACNILCVSYPRFADPG